MKIVKKVVVKILVFFGLKKGIKNIFFSLKKIIEIKYNNLFNITVKLQNTNIKSIPIIIISFNQLFYLKQLVNFLLKHNYNNIVIIDNNSTYEPLLEYFNEIESAVTIHRLRENYGHLVFWEIKELYEKYSKGYYVVTDADINPIKECPDDFLLYFKKNLDSDFRITKVGFSLKIDDIPSTNVNKEKIVKWESRFWTKQLKNGNYNGEIDTTFALYRPNYKMQSNNFMNGIRTKYPFQAIHGGWYVDSQNLTNEQQYYILSCNKSSSWRVDNEGNLLNDYYKKVL